MRIRAGFSPSTPRAFQVSESTILVARAGGPGTDDHANRIQHSGTSGVTGAIIATSIVVGLSLVALGFFLFRRWKRSRAPKYALSGRDDNDHTEITTLSATTATPTSGANVVTVGRNTSIRSVMTLPPYRSKPSESEHVLGREGERDGIDVVVEMPTAEDEEALRENEMDALYQIRLARRRQIAEREERRQARRDARARNDNIALQNIRIQARNATETYSTEIQDLRSEHERTKETRQRAVSSVSYADVGVARHDGTRIRANSSESERIGLLSDAASIAASARSPSSLANPSSRPELHRRERSTSSVLSIDTMQSDNQLPQPTLVTTRSRASSTGQHTQAGSSPELIDAAEADLSAQSPPGYDEVSLNDLTPAQSRSTSPYPEPPPDYSAGPTEARNRRLSANMTDLAAEVTLTDPSSSARSGAGSDSSRSSSQDGQGGNRGPRAIPQLPSLRLAALPQIVIEPSSAVPKDEEHR